MCVEHQGHRRHNGQKQASTPFLSALAKVLAYLSGSERQPWSQGAWALTPALAFTRCLTLGKLLELCVPQISSHIVGIIPAIASCPGLNELINHLEQVLRYTKYSKKKKSVIPFSCSFYVSHQCGCLASCFMMQGWWEPRLLEKGGTKRLDKFSLTRKSDVRYQIPVVGCGARSHKA